MSDKSPYTGETYWTTTNSMKYTQIFDTIGMTWRGEWICKISKIEDLENHHVKIIYTNADSRWDIASKCVI